MRLVDDLKILSVNAGFRKLLGVRLVSHSGDGMFQAGMASLFFFRPEAMTDAAGVAAALIVMLLPFSIVGPFTGPFLDRWRRRQILVYGNILRAVLVAVAILAMETFDAGPLVYALVLVTLVSLERIAVRQTDLRGHADARVEVHRLRAEEDLILARILDDGQDPLF